MHGFVRVCLCQQLLLVAKGVRLHDCVCLHVSVHMRPRSCAQIVFRVLALSTSHFLR